ncbi:helix-turn-helix domain-containing protein [Sinomicrobium soli]|uniref:helix-turn-helix domain-containing protein n=1 Tax=Sinomicrobium sp. N-1-3-6 TaxID=2219864 RepID=UPI000DCD782A|nr:AraC family transcriptional regulator [Sinomicrobium sp. N-1-3-6]RAV28640.1 AraC family transcriptional regulator [Sinomicrobium sp. N-1-3-6]
MISMHLTYDAQKVYMKVLEECLKASSIEYELNGWSEVKLKGQPALSEIRTFKNKLREAGIYVIENSRHELIQRTKDTISEMILHQEDLKSPKLSTYLTEKLNYSYTYLSKIFSEHTHYSIEHFVILKKIDYAKKLLLESRLSLTQISYKLGYSSVGHLSKQFKKTTGMTPTAFYNIIQKRNRTL